MIASILSAFVSTTTIEWTDTPYTEDSILTWLAEHETVLVAEDEGDVVGVAAYGWFRDAVPAGNRRRRRSGTARSHPVRRRVGQAYDPGDEKKKRDGTRRTDMEPTTHKAHRTGVRLWHGSWRRVAVPQGVCVC